MTVGSDLLTSGARLGRLVWTESRLFEITGQWIDSTPEPAVRSFLSAISGHHGWHAELLSTLLPVVAGGPSTAELVVADPTHGTQVRDLDSVTGTTDRLRRWIEVTRSVIDGATDHIASSSVVAEGAVHRLLGVVVADERVDVASAEVLLLSLS